MVNASSTLASPVNWRRVRIDDVCTIKSGSTPLRSQHERYFTDGTIPWVKTMDLTNGFVYETDECITTQALQESSCPLLEPGTVLFAMYGGFNQIGRTGLMTFQGSVNQAISALIVDPNLIESEYLLHWLNASVSTWKRIAASSRKDPNITGRDVASFPVLLPPLPEQRKIAEILGTWDAAIERVTRLIAGLQRRKQGLMQRLLTGQVRFPEFAGEAWQETELGELVEPITRPETVSPGKTYRLIGVRWYLEGAHIHDVVSGDAFVSQSLSQIEAGDILYNKMWVSKAAFAVAKPEHAGAYGTGEYPQFRAKVGLDARFLAYAFHVPRFQHDATALCRGTTGRIRLHPRDFLQLKIALPPLAEQRKIAEFFATVDQEINLQQQRLAALRQQKQGLMQRLLTGQVRVPLAAADAPAGAATQAG